MNRPTALLLLALCAAILSPHASSARARDARPSVGQYNLDGRGLALDGYDPVAYFPEGGGAARKGRSELELEHAGVRYRFATEANRELFLARPDRFEPEYGGWCAYAMGKNGEKVEVDPESFRVRGGRLFVFYDGFLNDTRKKWLKDEDGLRVQADRAWLAISGEAAQRDVGAYNLGAGDLVLGGYDPVAYLADEPAATPGRAELELEHDGQRFRFASEENRAAFRADPARYEPAYGGWCAFAMAGQRRVDVDPRAFVVQDGRLHLFASGDTRERWIAGQPALRAQADASWTAILRGE